MVRMDYETLFVATPSPYLVLDPDLVIIEANRRRGSEPTGRTARTRRGEARHGEVHRASAGEPCRGL